MSGWTRCDNCGCGIEIENFDPKVTYSYECQRCLDADVDEEYDDDNYDE